MPYLFHLFVVQVFNEREICQVSHQFIKLTLTSLRKRKRGVFFYKLP